MSVSKVTSSSIAAATHLVVVHSLGKHIIKGTFEWDGVSESTIPPAPLPELLRIECGSSTEVKVVPLRESKAIFFVRTPDGNNEHEEVKFFENVTPNYVWVRIKFADGETLEGRAENSSRLLFDPGIWLQPFDMTGNNSLVYIPKSSIIDFHIMGVSEIDLPLK